MFSAQAAANKRTATKEAAVTEDSVLKDIMAELKQEPVLLSSAKTTPKNAGTQFCCLSLRLSDSLPGILRST